MAKRSPVAADQAQLLKLGATDAATRTRELARVLVNTKFYPPGFQALRLTAHEAMAYHNLRPYPYFAFAEWKTEERGPMPRCLPIAQRTVRKGSRWLFGQPVQIKVPGNERLEKFLRQQWQRNRMPTRMVAAAERGGVQGGIALKWAYDETADPKLSIQVLSVIDECRLFYDPHDRDKLLMARVQYSVFNPQDGDLYIYREEWTDDEEIHYQPVRGTTTNLAVVGSTQTMAYGSTVVVEGTRSEPDVYGEWQIIDRKANPFGIIPIWPIRNIDRGGTWGWGDWWVDAGGGMLRLLDRINLTFHMMDKSNQFDGERNLVFLDVAASQDALDRPLAPGNPLSLKSENYGENARGQVIELEASGQMRPHMMDYAKELRWELLAAISSVDVRTDEVTNKGNMTQAVLSQLYAPLIEATSEKRKTYGEDGICKFLERCAIGLKNLGAKEDGIEDVGIDNEESHDVQLTWPDYFESTDDEKSARVSRLIQERDAGWMTDERAIETVAEMEGIEDVTKFKTEATSEAGEREDKEEERFNAELNVKKAAHAPSVETK